MATQSNTEEGLSYQKYTVQLLREIATRAGNTPSKDEDFLNVLLEVVKDASAKDRREFVLKRGGVVKAINSQVASEVRGMIYWEDQFKLLYAADDNVYVYNFTTDTLTTLANVFSTTSGEVGFTEYLYDTNAVVIIATDGTTLISIDITNTVVTCADLDLPAPHFPNPVFLDGYLFLAKTGTADIYNSDLNNPMAWTPGDLISAEMQPDYVKRIGKINNYLVVFGSESIEYFWDAANATGSPLSRNDSPIKLNTYLGGFAQYGNDVVYIGKSSGGEPGVFLLRDFKLELISTPAISRYLNITLENILTWHGGLASIQGHTVYIMNVGDLTWVYDFDSKLWVRWAYKQTTTFPICYTSRVTTQVTRNTFMAFTGADSSIYYLDDEAGQDESTNFTCRVITEQSNYGTLNRKTMHRFALYADRTPANSNISLYWTDDDFQTWSSARTINMNQDLQSTYRMGSFRQRAFKLEYTDQYILRLQQIEVDINKGIS